MTKKLVFFFSLMLAAFSMKKKRKTKSSPIRDPNARRASARRTPLVAKNTWSIVHGFLRPQNEQKFNEIHKSLSQFPTKYENISKDVKDKLRVNKNIAWLFFKHKETQKVVAENITEKTNCGTTPLHVAVTVNEVEIAKAVIEAGVDIDAKPEDGLQLGMTPLHLVAIRGSYAVARVLIGAGAQLDFEMTALHWAAILNYLEIGRVIVEGGADLNITWNSQTALEIAVKRNHGAFAEMLRKHVKKNN